LLMLLMLKVAIFIGRRLRPDGARESLPYHSDGTG
jgi:hypothetical protein